MGFLKVMSFSKGAAMPLYNLFIFWAGQGCPDASRLETAIQQIQAIQKTFGTKIS